MTNFAESSHYLRFMLAHSVDAFCACGAHVVHECIAVAVAVAVAVTVTTAGPRLEMSVGAQAPPSLR